MKISNAKAIHIVKSLMANALPKLDKEYGFVNAQQNGENTKT
jgi:hypothetical protein